MGRIWDSIKVLKTMIQRLKCISCNYSKQKDAEEIESIKIIND
jgi:hypothetical protein